MLLYAVADIHGRFDRIAAIKKNLTAYCPDVIVAAGDITNYVNSSSIISELGNLLIPVVVIRGNSDLKRTERQFFLKENMIFLNNCDMVIKDIHFAGLSGTIPFPFRSRIAFRETVILGKVIPLITSKTVLISHSPPWGQLDRVMGKYHAGCKSLEKVVRDSQPAMLICGHIHEDAGMTRTGNTIIINCAMGSSCEGAIIDIQNENITVEILKKQ